MGRTTARVAATRRSARRGRLAASALRLWGSGGYQGARTDRPALKNWTPQLGGPNSDTLPDLGELRARSADLERNAPLATGVIATNVTSTVGTGIVPHARIDRDFLGLPDEQADQFERDAERVFALWAETHACDLAGRLDFYSMQGLGLRSVLGRGDLFVVRRFVERPGDVLATRLQLIEADRVSNPVGIPETDRFLGGLELDADGRPITVHVRDSHPGEWIGAAPVWVPEPVYGAATGQRRVLHVMDHLRVGQVRGVPYLAPVMETLKQLDRYTEAEVMAAVVNSFLTIFIKQAIEDDTGALPDMGDPATLADVRAATPESANDVRLAAGAVVGLMPGEEIQQTNVSRPNPQFDPFVLAVLRQVGVGLEVPYELLVKHFTASYSASRAAMLEAWRSTMRRRSWLTATLNQPVWEWVIEEAVTRGLLVAPGFFDSPFTRHAYLQAEWLGPAMGSLDPESDVAAAAARVDLGISTLAQETAQLTGGDWERNHRQRVKEHRMRVRDGLDAEEVAQRIVTEPKTPEPPQDATDGGGQPPAEPDAPTQRQTPAAAARRARRISPAREAREEARHG